MVSIPEGELSLSQRKKVISKFPLFFLLNSEDVLELALLAKEVELNSGDLIVEQGGIVDSFYLIVSGSALVIKTIVTVEKTETMDIATLGPGDSIGLSLTGFFSPNGIRNSSVIAKSAMKLLAFQIRDFNRFLKHHGLSYPALKNDSDILVLLEFLKDLNIFTDSTSNCINRITKYVKRVSLLKGENLFKKGDIANHCYFLINGEMNILSDASDYEKGVKTLTPVTLLGEEVFLDQGRRCSDAVATIESELFAIEKKDIKTLVSDNESILSLFKQAHIYQIRPIACPYTAIKGTHNMDSEVTLIMPDNRKILISSKEYYVLKVIDGHRTLFNILSHCNGLNIESLYFIVYSLHKKGVVDIPTLEFFSYKRSSTVTRLVNRIKSLWKQNGI